MGNRWTPERCEWFRAYAPGKFWYEVSEEHEKVFGYPLTRPMVKNARIKLGVTSGVTGGRFEKGHVPFNKGKTWDEFMPKESQERSRTTTFKKGNMPANGNQPIGTERIGSDGYVWVKVAERKTDPKSAHDNWVQKHRKVWEDANGPIPENHVVMFADGDRSNCELGNLVCIPRSSLSIINHEELPWHDKETLETVANIAAVKHAAYTKRGTCPRTCAVCGRVFEPTEKQSRYPKPVRTCPECIASGRRAGRRTI